jgi:hypothetical protein
MKYPHTDDTFNWAMAMLRRIAIDGWQEWVHVQQRAMLEGESKQRIIQVATTYISSKKIGHSKRALKN